MSEIRTIAVIGAGQMGAGIAQVSASCGYETFLWDSAPAALEKGAKLIDSHLARAVEKEKITQADRDATLKRLKSARSMEDLAPADLVIEAIIERFEAKAETFTAVAKVVKPTCIFASNTSSISITKLAAASDRAEKFIGMHFMNPVPVMKLLEIIRGLQTSDATYAAAQAVSAKMEKTSVLAIDSPGFIVNRILVPMVNEAIFLLEQGVKPEDIDAAMKLGTNQPMGPLALADFVGLDTLLFILRILHNELGDDKYRPCPLLVKYVEAGWYGKKSGRGFYKY